MSMKILIVDDIQAERNILKSILEEYEIFEAVCGVSAIEESNAKFPDLIIMDIIMPNLDGFSTLKRLKSNERTKNIPVIITKENPTASDIMWAQRQGASEFLAKPFTKNKVLEVIKLASIPYFKHCLEKELDSSNQTKSPIVKI